MRRLAALVAVAALTGTAIWVLRDGDLPQTAGRWLPLDLTQPVQVFRDWRIAALAKDRDLCLKVLAPPLVRANAVADHPLADGCGWSNAVRLDAAGDANLGVEPITCPMAAAIAMWLLHEVQPEAQRILGKKVKNLKTLGSYACRGMIGDAYSQRLRALGLPPPRSEHASANALDIAAFELENGDSISVLKDWRGGGVKADFLRAVHEGACRFFRVVLGPDANAAHANHFHLDRGPWQTCR